MYNKLLLCWLNIILFLFVGKAFLFCNAGYRKSPALAMAYLMTKRGMNLTEASRLVSKKRRILPHDGLIKQLCVLNKKLYG